MPLQRAATNSAKEIRTRPALERRSGLKPALQARRCGAVSIVRKFTNAREFPSPLNGEKVAAGRMRGGNTRDSASVDSYSQYHLTLSPLTPALPMNQSRHCVSNVSGEINAAVAGRRGALGTAPPYPALAHFDAIECLYAKVGRRCPHRAGPGTCVLYPKKGSGVQGAICFGEFSPR